MIEKENLNTEYMIYFRPLAYCLNFFLLSIKDSKLDDKERARLVNMIYGVVYAPTVNIISEYIRTSPESCFNETKNIIGESAERTFNETKNIIGESAERTFNATRK